MKVFALYSIKGGVGKTATCVNLASLASKKNKTLLIDLDPQASASFYFRIRAEKKFSEKKFLKGGKAIQKNIKATDYENLDLLPADMSYRNLDLQLDDLKKSDKRLKTLLQDFKDEYNYVFLDCPPNLTLLSENIFNASDKVLIPIIPTTLSVRTYEQVLGFFKQEGLGKKKLTPFYSMVEKRKKLHNEVMKQFSASYKNTLPHSIAASADIEKMGIHQTPVFDFISPRSQSAVQYKALWQAITA